MEYTLIKLSSPGFDFNTDNLGYVHVVLELFICDQCKIRTDDEYNVLPENYEQLGIDEQVYAMLGTPCGAEFLLEENHVEGMTVTHEVLF